MGNKSRKITKLVKRLQPQGKHVQTELWIRFRIFFVSILTLTFRNGIFIENKFDVRHAAQPAYVVFLFTLNTIKKTSLLQNKAGNDIQIDQQTKKMAIELSPAPIHSSAPNQLM